MLSANPLLILEVVNKQILDSLIHTFFVSFALGAYYSTGLSFLLISTLSINNIILDFWMGVSQMPGLKFCGVLTWHLSRWNPANDEKDWMV